MNNISDTGAAARDLLHTGVEVNAEIALDEPQMAHGCDVALFKLVRKHGAVAVLEALHDAAWGGAEMHEEDDEVTCLRLRVFGKRLAGAIDALK